MSLQEVVESALNLDTVERRELVDALRASLEDSDVPPATAALIDERLAEARAHPERSTRLDEVERDVCPKVGVSFIVYLRDAAQADLVKAEAYYDAEAPDQTDHFLREFFRASNLLARFPYAAPQLRQEARRVSRT
ncbi:MAG: hypothetical protein ACTMIK_06210 [Galactobacter sp.]